MDAQDQPNQIDQLEQELETLGDSGDPHEVNRVLASLGLEYMQTEDFGTAREYFQQQLARSRDSNYLEGRQEALEHLGYVCLETGKPQKAMEHFEESLDLARRLQETWRICQQLDNLAETWRRLDRPQEAISCLEQAVEIAREDDNNWAEGVALDSLAMLHYDLEKPDIARDYTEKALALTLSQDDLEQIAFRASYLAIACSHLDDIATAVALHAFALDRFQQLDDDNQAQNCLEHLGLYRGEMGADAFAEALHNAEQTVAAIFAQLAGDQAAEIARPLNVATDQIPDETELLYRIFGDFSTDELEQAVAMAREEHDAHGITMIIAEVARQYLERGMYERARDLLTRTIDDVRDTADDQELAALCAANGIALAAMGQTDEARELLLQALEAAEKADDDDAHANIALMLETVETGRLKTD